MVLLWFLWGTLAPQALGADSDQASFFESKIRPLLTEHCLSCHSSQALAAKKLKGGLFLDSKEGWVKGGDSGPAIIPGKPAESLLFQSLGHDGDLKMPPKGKLPEAAIRDLETWISKGAFDPRTGTTKIASKTMSVEEGKRFWAYRPLSRPTPPQVTRKDWPANDLDRFILARLEEANLKPLGQADRATQLRRLYLDLIGLPPTPSEILAFETDSSPNAWNKRVDELLARPEFGERWARHWLDVARYADSVTLRGLVYKHAWKYRDYVIDRINQDTPYGRFLEEQIAGDLLDASTPEDKARNLIATTYLMLGNTNLEEQDKKQLRMDVVDEQLDAISKGLLAQTITCARCHDHKFDPISTRDYYALAGIFRNTKVMIHANVSGWTELPLPLDPSLEKPIKEQEQAIAKLEAEIKALKGAKSKPGDAKGILTTSRLAGVVVDDTQAKKVGQWQESTHSGTYIESGYVHDQNAEKGQKTLTFSPNLPNDGKYEVRLAYSAGNSRADSVPVTVFSAEGDKTILVDMKKAPPLEGRFLSLGTYAFEKSGQSFVIVSNEGTTGHVTADCVVFLPQGESTFKEKTSAGKDDVAKSTLSEKEARLKALKSKGPVRPMAMAPQEESTIEDCRIHIRGVVSNLGPTVPRGVPQVMTAAASPAFPTKASGRKELAAWLASNSNPLPRRVMANRVWHWLMGAGLVRTVDNFGTTGEAPSHPELLDWLAGYLGDEGDSLKKLIRLIVTSRTYRLASFEQDPSLLDELVRKDPDNRLLGRANPRRVEAEALRDSILFVSGQLDPKRYGADFGMDLQADYGFRSTSNRRSIYLPVFRNAMPEILEVFDAADTSMVTGKRNASTVAPQALYLLNNPWVREQANHAAKKHLEQTAGQDNAARLNLAYRSTLGRLPTAGESSIALNHLNQGADPLKGWTEMFHALFASADFRTIE